MRNTLRTSTCLGMWGFAMLGVLPSGCGSGIDSVAVRPGAPKDGLAMPRITEERMQACVTEYAKQLEAGDWAFRPTIEVAQNGRFIGVDDGGIPNTAADFASCTRDALSNMVVPDVIFNLRTAGANAEPTSATAEQRMQMGSPAVVVVVVVGLSELVFEAGAYTILFAVTVKVVEKAADDVMDAAKRWRPKPNLNRCFDAAAGGEYLWQELCRSISDAYDRRKCWEHTYLSEEEKRNWCRWRFGN